MIFRLRDKGHKPLAQALLVDQGLPCVIFMGGGYSDPIGHTVDAFLDLFTAAAIANGQMQRATGPEGRHREREAV